MLINRRTASKVPQVTAFFWIIKILSTTVGETAADTLNINMGLGLTRTTAVMGVVLVIVLAVQFALSRYVPVVYWLAVVLLSIVGTLITDNLTDNLNVPLVISAAAFAAALVTVFVVWYAVERTLSIHSIFTLRREAFYWLAILFTFALGTAAGDLVAERFGLGYLASALIVAALICAVSALHYGVNLHGVAAFWIAYILTRPLGASLGDLLSQDHAAGGLQLGAVTTSVIFGSIIVVLVGYLSWSSADRISAGGAPEPRSAQGAPREELAVQRP